GVQFKNCQGPRGGAISYVGNDNNNLNINGSTSFTSCSSLSNPGGAIHSILNNGGSTLIENIQFDLCNSVNSDGGSIFVSINSGTLSINQVRFIGSSCSQPGSGGAIAIVQQNSNSRISITESSFTNCQTLPGTSNQYGWGGAIYINISYNQPQLNATNFQLTNLSFTNCKASGAGNNLHIRSTNTESTGSSISRQSLLTVKGTIDLYSKDIYYYDYMGIDESKVNDGNAPFSDHQPLFYNPEIIIQFQTPQDPDSYSAQSLCHSIVSINGGIMKIERAMIERVFRKNEIEIIQSAFSNIEKLGAGNGAVINAELYQDSILKVTDSCTFYNCSTQQNDNCVGGAINAVVNGSNSQFIVSDLVKFEKCQSFKGGAISAELLNMGSCVVNNVQFKECIVNNDGGGIFAQLQNSGGTLTITNQTSFDQCINNAWGGGGINIVNKGSNSSCIISDNAIFEKCEAGMGSAIYLDQCDGASFEVHNVYFKECFSKGQGRTIHYELRNQNDISSFILDEAQFIGYSTKQNGGSALIKMSSGTSTISGSTFSCSKSVDRGGAINADIWSGAALIIDNAQFESCNSANFDGGSIFAQIDSGTLSINQVRFIGSSCSQPGSGGAITIVQYNSYSRISITESSFMNCQTLPGTSNQYGWGGAIYINIQYNPPTLTTTNFQLTNLSFTNCKASGAGNNLHILSDDTTAVGNQIKTGSLLTVKDLFDPTNIISDLYTNEWYCFDYMGINKSKANSGNAPFTDHEPLFVSPSLTPKFN
ncbi:MAG: hypothetical protein EZS28_033828, partial [Streblomastix strix]